MSVRRVRDLMTGGVFALLPDDDLVMAHRLMEGWRVRHAPVVEEDGSVVGVLSQRDMLRRTLLGRSGVSDEELEENLRGIRVKEVMTVHVETIRPDAPLAVAATKIYEEKIGCLVVVDRRGRLRGILTESDFVRDAFPWEDSMQNWGRGFTLGATLGIIGGVVFGLLYAPEEGKKTRRELARRGEELSHKAGDALDTATAWVEKQRERVSA